MSLTVRLEKVNQFLQAIQSHYPNVAEVVDPNELRKVTESSLAGDDIEVRNCVTPQPPAWERVDPDQLFKDCARYNLAFSFYHALESILGTGINKTIRGVNDLKGVVRIVLETSPDHVSGAMLNKDYFLAIKKILTDILSKALELDQGELDKFYSVVLEYKNRA
ncbi:MAG: hypothetical protein HYY52_08595 [Candidatus Melainabacteria bacterium]|nr:hypothetical protein [Candidatus Melainabacteria bacterium]